MAFNLISKFWLGLIIAGSCLFTLPSYADFVPPTQIADYQPDCPQGPPQAGGCWTTSLILKRPNAWRCYVHGHPFDPCFNGPTPNQVICDADPMTHKPGFLVELEGVRPLPPGGNMRSHRFAWILELADGTVCKYRTLYVDYVDAVPIMYLCSDSYNCKVNGNCSYLSGILGTPSYGRVWKVQKVIYTPAPDMGSIIRQQRTVAVTKVWQ